MKKSNCLKQILFCAVSFPVFAHAGPPATEPPLLPVPKSAVLQNDDEIPSVKPAEKQPETQAAEVPQGMDADDAALLAAMKKQDFAELERLLAKPVHQGQNRLLRLDAQAALALKKGNYPQAVTNYRQILAAAPDLHSVRLDLAAGLMMDRQFREAEHEFKAVQAQTNPKSAWHTKAGQYLNAIRKAEKWQPEISGNYLNTDNVNNATSENEFVINGIKFVRRDEYKPQSARGFAYQFGLRREKNLSGHHYLTHNFSFGGTHYFGKSDYDEQVLTLETGYKYKTAKQFAGIAPFFTQRWYGGTRYSRSAGLKADYFRQLGQTVSAYANVQHEQIRYHDPANRKYYDGFTNTALIRGYKTFKERSTLYFGLQTDKVHRKTQSEGSTSYGAHLGFNYNHPQWGIKLYSRFNRRQYDARHFLFGITRKDDELRFIGSVHFKKLAWHKITPEFNYVYDRYTSNLKLYNRSSGQFFISVAKDF